MDLDLAYSYALLVALVAGGAGALLSALAVFRGAPEGRASIGASGGAPVIMRIAAGTLGAAAVSLLVSVGVHRSAGHGPASIEPMAVAEFASAHPAFFVAGALIVSGAAMLGCARGRARTRRHRTTS